MVLLWQTGVAGGCFCATSKSSLARSSKGRQPRSRLPSETAPLIAFDFSVLYSYLSPWLLATLCNFLCLFDSVFSQRLIDNTRFKSGVDLNRTTLAAFVGERSRAWGNSNIVFVLCRLAEAT